VNRGQTKWAEVDLRGISENVALIKKEVGPQTQVMAVVKANGYGHGAVNAARAALRGGASWLGVSSVAEGIELREARLDAPVLNLGYTPTEAAQEAIDARLSLTLYDASNLRQLQNLRTARPIRVHIKVDTGMHRLGASPEKALELVEAVSKDRHFELEGIFTHFAVADEDDPAFTRKQLEEFLLFRDKAKAITKVGLVHAANSAGLLRFPDARLDLVRAGLLIYGVRPRREWSDLGGLRPALSWQTIVTNVVNLEAGESVGYGRTFTAQKSGTRVATVACGYADGLNRKLSNRGKAIVRGRLVPIVGTISMDQAALDVSELPEVQLGDTVTLIGRDGEASWTADDTAEALGTISYEVLCAISARVPRQYRGL
jgi:alanine racemase